jgi:integrase/recombinase XerD
MTTIETSTRTVVLPTDDFVIDDAQLAAVAFLARYSGRTLNAYRHDLRGFFQWAEDTGLVVLSATRPHIELYRSWMEQRGLAASTIDRRLSTVCGFYRFAHIDGRIGSNPAQYVRRPKVQPNEGRGMDRAELGTFLFTAERFDRDHAALAVLLGLNGLRVSEACGTNIEDLAFQRGHRTLAILGKGNKPATIPLVPRTARTIDLVVGERHEGPILRRQDGQRLDRRTAHRWVRAIGKRAGLGLVHPHMPPVTPTREPRPSMTDGARTSTATPPMSSSRSSPAADPRPHRLQRHVGDTSSSFWPRVRRHLGPSCSAREPSFRSAERTVRTGRQTCVISARIYPLADKELSTATCGNVAGAP